MDFKVRKAELLAELKQLEKEERKAMAAEIKAEQRKKNDFCKREFGVSYSEIKDSVLGKASPKKSLTKEEELAIKFWEDLKNRYQTADINALMEHILSDRQVSYYAHIQQ